MRRHAEEVIRILKDHDFDSETKRALADYFEFSAKKYYALRRALIIFGIIVSLGCAFSIAGLKYYGQQTGYTACKAGNESRQALRDVIDRVGKPTTSRIHVTPGSELDHVLKQSRANSKEFVKDAKAKTQDRDCSNLKPHVFIVF